MASSKPFSVLQPFKRGKTVATLKDIKSSMAIFFWLERLLQAKPFNHQTLAYISIQPSMPIQRYSS
jgi:hypothetical protein